MSPSQAPKFFDVAPPGKAAPSPTSRPVIARAPAPDPFLHQAVSPPLQARPQPAAPAEVAQPVASPEPPEQPAASLDPTALLIQADAYTPLKPSRSAGRHVALTAMALMLVILCAATYWLVSTM